MGLHRPAWGWMGWGAEGRGCQCAAGTHTWLSWQALPSFSSSPHMHMGKRQRMLRRMLRRLWSQCSPPEQRDQPAWGAAGSYRSPGSCLGSRHGSEEWLGMAEGVPGTPASLAGALCCSAAAPALLAPRELAEGMPAFISPSSCLHHDTLSSCSKPSCPASQRDEPWGRAATCSSATCGWSPWAWAPLGSRGQWGGFAPQRAPMAWALRRVERNTRCPHPCKAEETSVPPWVTTHMGSPMSFGSLLTCEILC